jgi:hypothetical protein
VTPLFAALLVARSSRPMLASTLLLLPSRSGSLGRWALFVPRSSSGVSGQGHCRATVSRPRTVAEGHVADRRRRCARAGHRSTVGALLILGTSAPFWLVNVVAGGIYAVMMPFVARRPRTCTSTPESGKLAREDAPARLPAEISLGLNAHERFGDPIRRRPAAQGRKSSS